MKALGYLGVLLVLALLVGSGGAARAVEPRAPGGVNAFATGSGTALTYQGRLLDGGSPANGSFDLRFILYDAQVGGSQVGSTVTVEDVAVSGGLFTVLLDFGSSPFTGQPRWLEVGVRPRASAGDFAVLSPRQPLTPTPYAIHATTAVTTTTAPWSGLTGVPAGLADGVDDNTTYTPGSGLALSGNQFSVAFGGSGSASTVARSDHGHYARTVVVSPVGSATANGTALRSALAAITTASPTNPYLLKIEPGVYDVSGTALIMRSYVDVEGSGELTTVISGSVVVPAGVLTGTVVGVSNAELRFLAVKSTGGENAIAIYNSGASPRLTHVTASASGGLVNIGVFNRDSSPSMNNVTVSASDTGVGNNGSSPSMDNVTVSASQRGVNNQESSPTIRNSRISSSWVGIDTWPPTSGTYTVTVTNSYVVGGTPVWGSPGYTVRVGASQLDGGQVNLDGGTWACTGVYDKNFVGLNGTCQ